MDKKIVICAKNIKKTFKLSLKQRKINKTKEKFKVALNGVSFDVYNGEIFGLLGPNGAGKTTTLRILSTLIKPDSGEAYINGISFKNEVEIKKMIGFLTNELKLEDQMTPRYAFRYFARFYGLTEDEIVEREKYLFSKFAIDNFSEVKIGELSTGMKQKVSIVVSLAHNPDVIIFDEPTNGLDIITSKQILDYLKELRKENKTIIISTHIMDLVEKLCDRVAIIMDGEVKICGTLEEIKQSVKKNTIEDVFFELYKESKGE